MSAKEQGRLPMVCDTMLRVLNLSGNIAQIIFARTTPNHINVHNLERVFQRAVLQVGNLTELCIIGASVQHGVLQGYIKDVLLLRIISQAIDIADTNGTMVQIIPAETTIPARLTQTAYITGSELYIRQGNNTIANQNPVISTLHFNNTGISQRRQVEITIDVDVNYGCRIETKDFVTYERICSTIE